MAPFLNEIYLKDALRLLQYLVSDERPLEMDEKLFPAAMEQLDTLSQLFPMLYRAYRLGEVTFRKEGYDMCFAAHQEFLEDYKQRDELFASRDAKIRKLERLVSSAETHFMCVGDKHSSFDMKMKQAEEWLAQYAKAQEK